MLRLAIIDDDRYMLEIIEGMVQDVGSLSVNFSVIEKFTDSEKVLQQIESGQDYHIYIIDIEMPNIDGMQLAGEIRKKQPGAYLIFLTFHEEYAIRGYEVRAYDYILKEAMEKRLILSLQKICREVEEYQGNVYLFRGIDSYEKIPYRDIYYIYKEQKNAVFVTRNGKKRIRKSLREISEELEADDFMKVDRGYIVNISHIMRMEGKELLLRNGSKVPVSRPHVSQAKAVLYDYWRRKMG